MSCEMEPFGVEVPVPIYFRSISFPAEASTPIHHHVPGEFVYAFSGVMELKLENHHYLAPPQYGIWMPPGAEHHSLNRYESSFCSIYIARDLCSGLPQKDPVPLAVSPLVRAILDDLRAREVRFPQSDADVHLLHVLVDQLRKAPRQSNYLPMSSDPQLGPVLSALDQDPADNRSLADWAKEVHGTERTLARRCHRDLGMNFSEWRQRLRMVRALAMLADGLSVERIGLELGYNSSSAFIAMFRRMVGTTPEEFRKRAAVPRSD
jgi:AraC-like DNA-binding protein